MDETQSNTTTTTEEKKGMNPLWMAGGVIAVIVIIASFILYSSKPAKTNTVPSVQPTTGVVQGASTTTEANAIQVEGGNFYFKPDTIKVKKGDKVKITFTNSEGIHDFVIDEFGVATNRVKSGNSETVEFTPNKTGTFEFYCSVGNHRQMGMKGTLVVE